MSKYIKPVVATVLILITLFNVGSAVFTAKDKYTAFNLQQRYDSLKFAYEDSQYANKKATAWIPDEPVNTYAGMAYVKGVNPVLIASDTPPLGRYLIGATGLIFNNENVITLIAGAISLLFLYLLGTQLFSSKVIALIPLALVSFEPLFKNQFIYTPLLDLMQLMFLLPLFYVFNIALVRKKGYTKYFVGASILLGCFIATKFFVSGVTIVGASIIVLLLNFDKRKFLTYIFTLPIAVFVLLFTYVRALFDDPNLRNFLGIQKYVYTYHKSQLMFPFSIWPFIYFNQWYVWWGDKPVISDNQWTYTWPVVTTLSLFTSIAYFFKKIPRKKEVEILLVWTIVYLGFFSIGQITPRYLVILLPVLYLIAVYGIVQLLPAKLKLIKS
jgi:hypothetical protein